MIGPHHGPRALLACPVSRDFPIKIPYALPTQSDQVPPWHDAPVTLGPVQQDVTTNQTLAYLSIKPIQLELTQLNELNTHSVTATLNVAICEANASGEVFRSITFSKSLHRTIY